MKIFLNEKTIELIPTRPCIILSHEEVLEYTSLPQLQTAFQQFETNDKTKLIIWSKQDFTTLKTTFFSLFKNIDAAGGLVKNELNELLFIYRLNKWDLPKGKLNKNETPEDAALREVQEETGLKKLKITAPLTTTHHIYTRKEKQILKKTTWYQMQAKSTQPLTPQKEEDIQEVKWIKKDQLPKILKNTYPSINQILSTIK